MGKKIAKDSLSRCFKEWSLDIALSASLGSIYKVSRCDRNPSGSGVVVSLRSKYTATVFWASLDMDANK